MATIHDELELKVNLKWDEDDLQILKLEPGDRVALRFDGYLSAEEAEDILRKVQQAWDLKAIILTPGVELTVVREEADGL